MALAPRVYGSGDRTSAKRELMIEYWKGIADLTSETRRRLVMRDKQVTTIRFLSGSEFCFMRYSDIYNNIVKGKV